MANRTNRPTPPTTRPTAPRTSSPAATDSPHSRTPARPNPSEDQIRARAYFLWEEAGRPECDGTHFWLEAEKELGNAR
jgi:hypothetical protein